MERPEPALGSWERPGWPGWAAWAAREVLTGLSVTSRRPVFVLLKPPWAKRCELAGPQYIWGPSENKILFADH